VIDLGADDECHPELFDHGNHARVVEHPVVVADVALDAALRASEDDLPIFEVAA
jgi:hypothetical protein